MFIVFETWEFELLTSDIYRPVYKSRHQNEVNPDQATKSKRPREGNFHDAGFLPPHPHLLHHGHWVGCQSSHNHTSKPLAPLHTDNHCGFYKVLALHNAHVSFVSYLGVWQSSACSSFAKPGKHFLIETEDAPEKGGADDYQNWGAGGNGRPTGDYQWKPQGPGGGRPTGR